MFHSWFYQVEMFQNLGDLVAGNFQYIFEANFFMPQKKRNNRHSNNTLHEP